MGTTSSGPIRAVGRPEGVISRPSRKRTETLPDVPRFKPWTSRSRAAATTLSRAMRSSLSMPDLRKARLRVSANARRRKGAGLSGLHGAGYRASAGARLVSRFLV